MNEPLRGCPTCGTPVAEIAGHDQWLRDYSTWLTDALPGRIAPMDFDCVLERNGRFLVQEFKPGGAPLPLGQRLTLKAAVRLGMDVWVVWDVGEGRVEVGAMDRSGNVRFIENMSKRKLRNRVVEWLEEVNKDG